MTDPGEHHPDHSDDLARRRRRERISDQFTDIGADAPMRFQVRRSVYCRRCSYDLRSLDVEGRCPECGLDIWPSVIHLVDPTASKLPQLRNPRGVGNALVWLFTCALLAATALAASELMLMLDVIPAAVARVPGLVLPIDLTLASGVIALGGLWSVYKFMPPRAEQPDFAVRRDLWWLAIALILWAGVSFALWERERTWMRIGLLPDADPVIAVRSFAHLAIAIAATIALRGVRGVLQTIGLRSREYRRAQGSKQGIKPMMMGTLGVAIGSACRAFGTYDPMPDILQYIGLIIVWVSIVMLLIGLVYLLVNAWWIRRVLRKPPPQLRDLLHPVPDRRRGDATK